MHVHELAFNCFRNLKPQRISFGARVCIIEGKNGQGKTSLLEAVYLLAHGKSFREQSPKNLLLWGTRQHRGERIELVSGKFSTDSGEKRLQYFLSGERRQISINERFVSTAADFYGQVAAVEFTPDDLFLIKGAPAERRNYIDRVLSLVDSIYIEALVKYQRALKQRNSLLRDLAGVSEGGLSATHIAELGSWELQLAEHAALIVERRKNFLRELTPFLLQYHELVAFHDIFDDAHGANEGLELSYKSSCAPDDQPVLVDDLVTRFEENRIRDVYAGLTTLGPHRDELEIDFRTSTGKKSARRAASQGQARTAALSLKLAAAKYVEQKTGEAPILLLDDVESELDPSRKEALYSLINERLQNQVLITTTEAEELLKNSIPEAEFKLVSHGEITA